MLGKPWPIRHKLIAFKRDPLAGVFVSVFVNPHLFGGNVTQAGFARFCSKLLSLSVFAFSGVKRFAQLGPFFGWPILNDFDNLITSDL